MARVEARIRQLCCLGLDSESLMPTLLRALHDFIPSYGNTFSWCDARGQLASIYDETPESRKLGALYVAEFFNRRDKELAPSYTESMLARRGVVRNAKFRVIGERAYRRSDLYNLLMRPLGYENVIQLFVSEHARPLGCLNLQRGPGDPDFTAGEENSLARLMPFIAHALTPNNAADADLVDTGESGLLIADRNGRLLAVSPQGQQLLYLATHDGARPGTRRVACDSLPTAVAVLCKRLDGVFAADAGAAAPVATHRNGWGRFTFRAHWLEGRDSPSGQIGITITREEPLVLRLLRYSRDLPLSQRQRQIAVLLAAGMSHEQIATRLGVSRNTAVSHARWIYNRLEVHDAMSLRERMLGQAAEA